MPVAKKSSAVQTHVALLRGVNVGGKNILPMKDLVSIFQAAGCGDVKNYIQSGNVVFTAPASLVKTLSLDIEEKIHARFGFRSPIVVRSEKDLHGVVERNPFDDAVTERVYVAFLKDRPDPVHVAKLDPDRSPPDEFIVLGREIYLHLPGGAGKSRLTNAWFDSVLKTTCTVRNWKTVLKLVEMCSDI